MARFGGETMGTSWSALIVTPPAGVGSLLEAELETVITAMSQWRPTSALTAFNRAPIGQWRAIPSNLATVLRAAFAVHAASDGAFDPAAGALSELWGFGAAGRRDAAPADAEVRAARSRSGAYGVEIDAERARRVRDVALDLSGIANPPAGA